MQALQEVCKSRTRLLELQRCEKLSRNASIVHKSYIRHESIYRVSYIQKIEYTENTIQGYKVIKHIINLNTLEKRTIFKDKNGSYISFKVSCKWIDPLVGIK